MRKVILALVVSSLFAMTACGAEEEETTEADALTPIEVDILMEDQIDTGETTLSVQVIHDDAPVNDASEVTFEVWQDGERDASEMIEGSLTGDGVYEASYVFEEDGTYYVVSHVTARDQHTMPSHDLVVGDVDTEATQVDNPSHEESHEIHNQTIGELNVDFSVVESDEQNHIQAAITYKGKMLKAADITFEIWTEATSDERQWLSAVEAEPGTYQANFDQNPDDDYFVTVHIENEELHDHIEFEL
ncbi:FixH family protein [Alkalibacillus aidingensis]|uniref:FixH family protein n=1 Tax=Alkalibacillus aidingensis TaxID=2747607 RepID=UPI00166089CA|nr:FixH family protein [Alkalibacillus aidingensis]